MIKNLIFLGAPGVGKGTLAKKVANEKKLVHISTGAIFRKEIDSGSKLGKQVQSIIASGKYISDDITNKIVEKTLINSEVIKNGFILDGYPRTINQVNFLKNLNIKNTKAILLKASDEIINQRLLKRAKKEQREDDTPEVVAKRIQIYNEKTAPLIKWYKNESMLLEINCEGTIEQNYNNLRELIF